MKIKRTYGVMVEVPFKQCSKCKKLILDPELRCKNFDLCNTFYRNQELVANFHWLFK